MVVWNVRTIAETQGIKTAAALTELTGLNKNTIGGIWNGTSTRVDRLTLLKLCRTLDCTPGELLLLEDTPDSARVGTTDIDRHDTP
jgi:putative transcriptional regulator